MVLPFLVEVELLLARLCWLEMYSRKFGLRLQGKFGNLLKTHTGQLANNAKDANRSERSTFLRRRAYLLAALAAATTLSKRLSPRKESQHGLRRRSPYVGPFGIVATVSSCASAASRSPVHA